MYRKAQKKRTKLSFVLSFTAFIFLFIFACVTFVGCAENDGDDDKKDAELPKITGIVVIHDSFVYDGEAHGIVLGGVLSSDKIYYSVDGQAWQESVLRVEPGEYTVYYKIVRRGYADYIGKTTLVILISNITDVVANDIICVLGKEVVVDFVGLKDGDRLKYSVDGGEYSDRLEVESVGIYTVSYTLTRLGVGSATGTFMLTVLPDIDGTYVGGGKRIVFEGAVAVIDGVEYDMTYGVDGRGHIEVGDGSVDFAVDGGVLEMGGVRYRKIEGDVRLVELNINGDAYYAAAADDDVFEIAFDDNCAAVSCGGEVLTRLDGFNYCESVLGANELRRKYIEGTVEFSAVVGFVEITLSLRADEEIEPVEQFVMYDGKPHALAVEFDDVLYYNDGAYEKAPTAYAEVGQYDYTLIVLRDGYLPRKVDGRLTILPDLSGVYVAENVGVLEINGMEARLNDCAVAFEVSLNGFTVDGKAGEFADGTVTVGETVYRLTDKNLMAFKVCGTVKVIERSKDIMLRLSEKDGKTNLLVTDAAKGTELLAIEVPEKVTAVKLGAEPMAIWSDSDGRFCLILEADLVGRVAWITIESTAFDEGGANA